MAAKALIPALGAAVLGPAATATAAASTIATAGLTALGGIATVAGGIIGGIGEAKMQKNMMDAEEEQRIAEEERAAARYAGVGDATKFWDSEIANPLQNSASVSPTGMGAATSSSPLNSSIQYNQDTRRLERGRG